MGTSDTGITTVYLIRHGETDWNAQHRWQGHADVPLNSKGRAQAAALAAWFQERDTTVDAIYSSDLQRALATAQPVSDALGLTVETDATLRELNVGRWEGLQSADIDERYPGMRRRWYDNVATYPLPEGESVGAMQTRMTRYYYDAVARHAGGTIMLVAHGGALTTLLAEVEGQSLAKAWMNRDRKFDNTGVTIVSHDHGSGASQLDTFNLTEHLSGLDED